MVARRLPALLPRRPLEMCARGVKHALPHRNCSARKQVSRSVDALRVTRFARILRVVRLIRVIRIFKFKTSIQRGPNPSKVRARASRPVSLRVFVIRFVFASTARLRLVCIWLS